MVTPRYPGSRAVPPGTTRGPPRLAGARRRRPRGTTPDDAPGASVPGRDQHRRAPPRPRRPDGHRRRDLVLLFSGAGRPTVAQHGPEDPGSARAVAELTGPDRAARPCPPRSSPATGSRWSAARSSTRAGSCSSPVPLPPAFDDACRAHDLGYDLLRHAAARGGTLGPWARAALDRRLADDLATACAAGAHPAPCRVLAGVADLAVAANSWRQGWSVPVVEHGPFAREEA